MDFNTAIKVLARGRGKSANESLEWHEALNKVKECVEFYCKTETDQGDLATSLLDWLSEGEFDGSENAEGLAIEWDCASL